MIESQAALRVDVFSDVVCPWCYIGERRLARALRERPDLAVVRRWRPFQLQPDLPPGASWQQFVDERFGGWTRARPMFARVAEAGAPEGIRFDFERVAAHPNTADAHRVILLAGEADRQWEVAERYFAAHFEEGRDLGDRYELAHLAAEVGLDAGAVRAFLETDEGVDAVRESQRDAARIGVRGVPFFVLGGRYAISGAQPYEVFLQALDGLGRE